MWSPLSPSHPLASCPVMKMTLQTAPRPSLGAPSTARLLSTAAASPAGRPADDSAREPPERWPTGLRPATLSLRRRSWRRDMVRQLPFLSLTPHSLSLSLSLQSPVLVVGGVSGPQTTSRGNWPHPTLPLHNQSHTHSLRPAQHQNLISG